MLKNNLNKIILCATAKNLVAGIWHGDQLQQHEVFLHDDAGQGMFAAWLAHYPEIPIYLIANAVEEDYRLESLPHSSGREKNALIERKLNQFYRGLIFRTAHFIQREKDKRKDDKFLFVALNNDEFLQIWINVIQQADAPLVGVYLLPMLSQLLCKQMSTPRKLGEPHILLCEKLSSGLRQSYLHNGRLRMSRLIPNVPEDPNQLGYFYLVETQKTRLYLMSKRFISREVTLNLQLVSLHDEDMQAIKQSFSQEPGIACETLNLRTITKQMHVNPLAIETLPELLHMQLLANGHQTENLAPKLLTKTFELIKISQWITKSAFALGLSGLALSSYFLMNGFEHQSQTQNALQATQMIQQRTVEATNQLPTLPQNAQALKTAVLVFNKIQQYPASPQRLMHVVSHAMEKSSEVALNRLRWVQTEDLSFQDEDDLKGLAANAANTLANNLTNNPAKATQLTELGFISAEISPFNGNYREAVQKVQQFSEQLKLAPEVAQVEILQTPVNMSSYSDLRGSTENIPNDALAPALFKIKLQLKPLTPQP